MERTNTDTGHYQLHVQLITQLRMQKRFSIDPQVLRQTKPRTQLQKPRIRLTLRLETKTTKPLTQSALSTPGITITLTWPLKITIRPIHRTKPSLTPNKPQLNGTLTKLVSLIDETLPMQATQPTKSNRQNHHKKSMRYRYHRRTRFHRLQNLMISTSSISSLLIISIYDHLHHNLIVCSWDKGSPPAPPNTVNCPRHKGHVGLCFFHADIHISWKYFLHCLQSSNSSFSLSISVKHIVQSVSSLRSISFYSFLPPPLILLFNL